jgi:hypothetical protein
MHANRNREWTRIDPPTQSDSTVLAQVLGCDKQQTKNSREDAKGRDGNSREKQTSPHLPL